MRVKIRILGLICCTFLIAGVSLQETRSSAKAKNFECSETGMNPCEYNMPMSLDNSGNVNNYQVEDTNDKQGKYCMGITNYSYTGNKAKKTLNIACYDEWVYCVKKLENSNRTVVASRAKGKRKIRFAVYDKKGKKTAEIIDTLSKKDGEPSTIKEIYMKGGSLYYVYTKIYGKQPHIRCINLKSGKVTDDILLKTGKGTYVWKMKIYKNRIYVLTYDSVYVYSIDGKKQLSYKLPARPDIFNNNEDISIFGNYIYFSNDNGIYRCSTKNKKGFELYYDAKDDANFGQCRVFGICAAGKDKFYVMFIEKYNIELNMPTKLVEYTTSAPEATDNLN